MKSGSAPKQKGQNALLVLLRDIFTGGKGYRTIKGDKTPFPTTIVLCAAAVTVLFLALVFALIRVSAISAEIADMKKEIVGVNSIVNILLKKSRTRQGNSGFPTRVGRQSY